MPAADALDKSQGANGALSCVSPCLQLYLQNSEYYSCAPLRISIAQGITYVVLSIALYFVVLKPLHTATDTRFVQCSALRLVLGQKVAFPNSTAYTASLSSFFSLQEQELFPRCIVSPTDAKDVAKAIQTLTFTSKVLRRLGLRECSFAIKGGGHSFWGGDANI